MTYETTNIDGICVVRCAGKLDSQSAGEAEATFNGLLDGGAEKLLINFAGVTFISSMGMRALLTVAKRLHASGGVLRICSLSPVITEVFHMSGFIRLLYIHPTEEDALRHFAG